MATSRRFWRLSTKVATAILVLSLVALTSAQRQGGRRGGGPGGPGGGGRPDIFGSLLGSYAPALHNVPYDGRFTFVRLMYDVAPGGYYYRPPGGRGVVPSWAHGYSNAEDNLTRILDSISAVHPRLDASNVLALDDPELFKFPIAFMTEAGFWELNDREAASFRAYLQKGGFVIFDDFRDPPRGGGGWYTFAENMRRVLPNAEIMDMTPADPIFHVFFDIDSFDIIPQAYDGPNGRPIIKGIYEDNDRDKRLMAIINYNTDVSQYWEFSGTGELPVDQSNEAYELGVNYIMYGLMH